MKWCPSTSAPRYASMYALNFLQIELILRLFENRNKQETENFNFSDENRLEQENVWASHVTRSLATENSTSESPTTLTTGCLDICTWPACWDDDIGCESGVIRAETPLEINSHEMQSSSQHDCSDESRLLVDLLPSWTPNQISENVFQTIKLDSETTVDSTGKFSSILSHQDSYAGPNGRLLNQKNLPKFKSDSVFAQQIVASCFKNRSSLQTSQ
jgi:hypothetical protein